MKRTEGIKNKRMWSWNAGLLLASRLLLGGIFIYASMDKIYMPSFFAKSIYNYQILPDTLINLTALVLPWLELALGVMLVAGMWLPGTVMLGTLMLLAFTGTLIFNMVRGLNISCGCFTNEPSTDPITWWTVMRDACFLVPAFYLLFANQAAKQTDE